LSCRLLRSIVFWLYVSLFEGTYCLHKDGCLLDCCAVSLVDVYRLSEVLAASIIRAMMETVSTSEIPVNFYQTTRHNNSDDSRHTRRHESLISHILPPSVALKTDAYVPPKRWHTARTLHGATA
jgi:hypothetical protein